MSSTAPAPAPRSRGLLLYGMYDVRELDRAPKVRISLISAALARQAHLEVIVGGRSARLQAMLRWLVSGRLRGVGAVYVESATSTALPHDIAFLALMRLLGRPVGIYFRDAFQLHRDLYPVKRRRQRLIDVIWRLTMPMMRSLATHRFAPSIQLARELRIVDPILLPPGTDPSLPDLGVGEPDRVATIVPLARNSGFETLLEAVRRVRETRPGVQLRVVCADPDPVLLAAIPSWVEVVAAQRPELADVLRAARVCVIPTPISAYSDLAIPLKLMDYFSFGKPVVLTASAENRRIVHETGAGLLVEDDAASMAAGIAQLLDDEGLAADLARRARNVAESPSWTWDARATAVRAALLGT
jgi:Glycosyl transferases group 1